MKSGSSPVAWQMPSKSNGPVSGESNHAAVEREHLGGIGACLTLPGSLLPILVETFGIRLVEAGSMLALQPLGYLLAVLSLEPGAASSPCG